LSLRLNYFTAAQARGADPNALGGAFYAGMDWPQVHIPAPLGHVMGVTDVVSKLRPLAAKIAYLCHGLLPSGLAKNRYFSGFAGFLPGSDLDAEGLASSSLGSFQDQRSSDLKLARYCTVTTRGRVGHRGRPAG
jgi:hypothetical protein